MIRIYECLNCHATMAGRGEPSKHSRCINCKASKIFWKLIYPVKG